MILYLYTTFYLIIIMLKALKISRLTFPLQTTPIVGINFKYSIFLSHRPVYGFAQDKSGLPRNKEEAFKMQEQIKLQSKP